MKRPDIFDKKVEIYVRLLEAKLERYAVEKEKAALFVVVKKQISEITDYLKTEKAAEKKGNVSIINEDVFDVLKELPKLTDSLDKLGQNLDKDLIEKAEAAMKQGVSKKGERSPEDMAEKMRRLKSEREKAG